MILQSIIFLTPFKDPNNVEINQLGLSRLPMIKYYTAVSLFSGIPFQFVCAFTPVLTIKFFLITQLISSKNVRITYLV